jgi:hypothetical protein
MRKKLGRKSVFTEKALHKLEEAFALDSTDEEACLFADIALSSLYNFQAQSSDKMDALAFIPNT